MQTANISEDINRCINIDKNEGEETEEPGPTGQRWDPLGADNEDSVFDHRAMVFESDCGYLGTSTTAVESNRIRSLEEEQEILTSSLMALTSHFAQVQFRLRQIVEAPGNERDQLLKNLEEFAFRGIPEITGNLDSPESEEVITNLERARQRQFELIDRLKRQLTELEKFAYESGAPVLPQSIVLEKQKIILDELKTKLNLNVNDTDLPQLSSEDLKNQVETAIGEFVGPLKMKEQLVAQLKTQITDLERFIAFLQCDSEETKLESIEETDKEKVEAYNTYSAKKKNANSSTKIKGNVKINSDFKKQDSEARTRQSTTLNNSEPPSFNSKAHSILDKASTLLQMFAVAQFGCGSNRFQKNTLKKTSKINHWGDTRAQLEVDIQEIISLAMALKKEREKMASKDPKYKPSTSSQSYYDFTNESDEGGGCAASYSEKKRGTLCVTSERYSLTNIELTTVIRRNFAVTLQKLVQHGLRSEANTATTLVPFIGCFNPPGLRENQNHNLASAAQEEDEGFSVTQGGRQMHAWELILEYYSIKNGEEYNETPARKLSESFNLDIGGATTVSNKQSLLCALGHIISLHTPYKRSYNSHFKAFVCAGLNSHRLVQWLNLIFQCNELIDTYYTAWSYVSRTGFRDALRSIDRLTKYDFDLPIDLAIRQFQNIKDVFM